MLLENNTDIAVVILYRFCVRGNYESARLLEHTTFHQKHLSAIFIKTPRNLANQRFRGAFYLLGLTLRQENFSFIIFLYLYSLRWFCSLNESCIFFLSGLEFFIILLHFCEAAFIFFDISRMEKFAGQRVMRVF